MARLDCTTALVTGGTDGIGKAIARNLAAAGADVHIVGRDVRKGVQAEHDLRLAAGHAGVHFLRADLSLVGETDRLGREVAERIPKLDRLVLSAGAVLGRHSITAEGVESNFATNYLSRFVLTQRFIPLLSTTGSPGAVSRILLIGGAAMNGRMRYPDINLTTRFSIFTVVSQFCRANDLFVIEQARRLERSQARVTIAELKLGIVRTNIRREFPLWMRILVPMLLDPILALTPDQVADQACWLLTEPEYEGVSGALFRYIRRFERISPDSLLWDPADGKRLWEFSMMLAERARSHLWQPDT